MDVTSSCSRRFAAVVAALVLAFGAPGRAGATTVVAVPDAALVDAATLIVEGTVTSHAAAPGGGYATDFAVRPERVLAGRAPAGALRVRVPGGVGADGRGLRVYGAPSFATGERVLLFLRLSGAGDGSWSVLHLFLGAFHERTVDGRRLALRPAAGAELRGDTDALPRDLDRFARWVERRAAGRREPARYRVRVRPSALRQALAPFTLFEIDGVHLRWFEFDGGGAVDWRMAPGGQPGLADGGAGEIRAALGAWNDDPATPVDLRLAGVTAAANGIDPDLGPDGVNSILFDDPTGVFDEPFDCAVGGVVARGGVWFHVEHAGSWNGRPFVVVEEADVVTNRNVACYLAGPAESGRNGAEIFAHEIGHTLGVGHSCGDGASGACDRPAEDDALMRAFAHGDGRGARLGSDDRAALAALYRPLTGPPEAPTHLRATAAGFGVVVLGWTDVAASEDAYVVERLRGETWVEAARLGPDVTSATLPGLAAGDTFAFRVRAENGLGSSPPSNVAEVTLPSTDTCRDAVADGGFEGGAPNAAWDEASTGFGTPICDVACDAAGVNRAHSGAWWAWFGGVARAEESSLSQELTIPAGAATLGFWLSEPLASGNGVDSLTVTLDGETLWSVGEGDARYGAGWTLVQLDVRRFADGGSHRLRFAAHLTGEKGASSFLVDDVGLLACSGPDRSPCLAGPATLCLGDGRFEITAGWRRGPATGSGVALPWSEATGGFALGSDPSSEPDLLVKLLDGRSLTGSHWLFWGGVSDEALRLRARDVVTGTAHTFRRTAGSRCGGARVAAFPAAPVGGPGLAVAGSSAGTCVPDAETLCLGAGRFAVRARWGASPLAAAATSLGDGTGAFAFFAPELLEILVRVEAAADGSVAIVAAPLTGEPYRVEVVDTATGATGALDHAAGDSCAAANFDAF